ncbi:TPA: restriction endonuclease subunit S [Vibrio harveyi]|nr:restriction endonuclease subunit S [Vibrio harveyi]
MTSKFEYIELSSLISEKPRNGLYKKKEFQGKGHRWIKMSEVYGNDFLLAQQTELLDVTASEISRFNCQAGDLLFGRTSLTLDGIGDCLLVGDVDDVPIFESNLFRVRFDGSKAYPLFYFYFFKSAIGKQLIQTIAKQTAATSITSTDFVSLSVPYAPLDRQKEIGDFLFLFDKKCEFNTQTNQTLEQMAQAIFKSWFVDFDPVKAKINGQQPEGMDEATASLFPEKLVESELGLIPEGWEVGTLSNVAKYCSARTNTDTITLENYISTENMLAEKRGVTAASKLPTAKTVAAYKSGDILVSNIRPYFKKIWLAEGSGGRSNDVLGFESVSVNTDSYLMNLLYQDTFFEYMTRTSKGAKMPRGDKTAIMNWDMAVPPVELREAFSAIVDKFYQLIPQNRAQNATLESLRDTLLPKLLSGEIELDKE